MPRSQKPRKRTQRFSKEQWLQGALDVLQKEGEAKIRIASLVTKLGVTKGSFYWHFKNRSDFLEQLVAYWAETSTRPVIDEISAIGGTPQERLYSLMDMLYRMKEKARYDIPIRALVIHEPQLLPIIRKLDKKRYAYIRSLFHEMGFRGDELEMRTRTFQVFHSMENAVYVHDSVAERKRALKLRHKFFTRR